MSESANTAEQGVVTGSQRARDTNRLRSIIALTRQVWGELPAGDARADLANALTCLECALYHVERGDRR